MGRCLNNGLERTYEDLKLDDLAIRPAEAKRFGAYLRGFETRLSLILPRKRANCLERTYEDLKHWKTVMAAVATIVWSVPTRI